MKRITAHNDKKSPLKNPVRLLLGALPSEVYKKKWGAISRELMQEGEYEHWRQSISREGFDLGRTHDRAAMIFRTHLGLSLGFFSASHQEQMEEVNRILGEFNPVNQS